MVWGKLRKWQQRETLNIHALCTCQKIYSDFKLVTCAHDLIPTETKGINVNVAYSTETVAINFSS